jgi:hypothetical protein
MAWVAIGLAILAVVGLLATAVLVPVFVRHRGITAADCQQQVPAGASTAAAQYLTALNTGYVGWTQVSRSLTAEHDVVHLDDLYAEEATDNALIQQVSQITFTGPAAQTAAQYLQVVREYTQQLSIAINQYGYYSADHQQFMELDDTRGVLAERMRSELGLPPAACAVGRP